MERRGAVRGGPRVVAVVVTHNRRELLETSLASVLGQERAVDEVVVVENASSDGTAELVEERFPGVDLVRLSQNVGGAGGFAVGIERAVSLHGADLVWVLDDDTVPRPDTLQELLWVKEQAPQVRLLASRVVWTDGRDHPMNTPRERPGTTGEERAEAARRGCVPIRSASFVSVLLDAQSVREAGLPIADYFLWNDDFEYTTRLLRDHVGWRSERSVVEHHTRTFGGSGDAPGERFYYEVRNKAWMLRSRGLTPAEKALYGGRTLLRWASTLVRSPQRTLLVSCLRRGVVDARRPPRTNHEVLARAQVPT